MAERATRRPARTGWCSGIAKKLASAQGEQREGRERHHGDGRALLVEQRVLRPGVAPAEQPDRRAVALDDGVPARDDVPQADGHVLGLDHLPGVGGADVAARRDLLELVVGQAGEEGHGAQRARGRRRSWPASGECWVGRARHAGSVVHDRARPAAAVRGGGAVVEVPAGAPPQEEADDGEEEPRHVVQRVEGHGRPGDDGDEGHQEDPGQRSGGAAAAGAAARWAAAAGRGTAR